MLMNGKKEERMKGSRKRLRDALRKEERRANKKTK